MFSFSFSFSVLITHIIRIEFRIIFIKWRSLTSQKINNNSYTYAKLLHFMNMKKYLYIKSSIQSTCFSLAFFLSFILPNDLERFRCCSLPLFNLMYEHKTAKHSTTQWQWQYKTAIVVVVVVMVMVWRCLVCNENEKNQLHGKEHTIFIFILSFIRRYYVRLYGKYQISMCVTVLYTVRMFVLVSVLVFVFISCILCDVHCSSLEYTMNTVPMWMCELPKVITLFCMRRILQNHNEQQLNK